MTAVKLHYTVDGPADAPAFVLGPSLGTTTDLWRPQVPALTQRYRLVRYDHRGHGQSPLPDGPYTIADLGRDVLALLDHLEIPRAHVGGLSLGGMVAMWLAVNAPDRVDRLALVCTSARLGPPQRWSERAATVRAHGMASIADVVMSRWLPDHVVETRPKVAAELRAMLVGTPVEGYALCCGAIEHMDLEPELSRITAPTLVIAGLADEATPVEHSRRIVAAIPRARLALVAGAAHLANVARPEVVTDLLSEFLDGCRR